MVHVNGVDLCVDTYGDSADPAILLLAGAASSMDWWEPEFCRRLAGGGRFVVRYDHRDTGRSVTYPPGAPGYTGDDLLADAIALVETVCGGRAHLAGVSMGGGMAQYIAVTRPDLVASLTLLSTSPGPADDLPPMADALKSEFADPPPEPDWNDRAAVVEHFVQAQLPFAGPRGFVEADVRAVVEIVVDRSTDVRSGGNHWMLSGDAEDVRPRLGEISVPTLVVHGADDQFFQPGHGEALRREITGADLLLLAGVGHQVPPRAKWDIVVASMLAVTGRA